MDDKFNIGLSPGLESVSVGLCGNDERKDVDLPAYKKFIKTDNGWVRCSSIDRIFKGRDDILYVVCHGEIHRVDESISMELLLNRCS